ncbi:uncharacterized protein LOC120324662 [Pipra filicauda]|uniref:Uncharacterized protein LOC120324662 n=1 Tax=Pipra filicauda TaxID=649802 RepID=A0A7R5KT09_9PASS|nr:uncharacterized protein LOC120324662 [Pipra filicauda]
MVYYCIEVWGGRPIGSGICWPIYGSFESWICEMLNFHVNEKRPYCPEECKYAVIWLGSSTPTRLFPLKEQGKQVNCNKDSELRSSPPPYIPPYWEESEVTPSAPRVSEPAILPEQRRESTILSPAGRKPADFSAQGRESAILSTPGRESAILSTPGRESAILSTPGRESAILSTPGRESAILSTQRRESAILSSTSVHLSADKASESFLPNDITEAHGIAEHPPQKSQLYPLRETAVPGRQGGIGFVSVPLSSGDVRAFKKEMGNLLEDPIGVSERFDQFLGPNTYTWDEMQAILGILFTVEERGMIRAAGMRNWDRRHQQGPAAETKWPIEKPNWNNQRPEDRALMDDLRSIIVQGIRESVPRGQNIDRAFKEYQRKEESPTDWLERLRKSFQLYSGMDPEDDAMGQAVLKLRFVQGSWEDIRKKLEKNRDWQTKGLDLLLREAQEVYVRRDEVREEEKQRRKEDMQRKQTRVLVAAIKGEQNAVRELEKKESFSHNDRSQRGKNKRTNYRELECYYCGQKGHIQRNCKKKQKDEQVFLED